MRIYVLLILLFFKTVSAFSSHMAGGNITYKHNGSSSYTIIVNILRDCRGGAFNGPTFGVFAGKNGSNSCGNSSLSFTRTSIKDISPTCSTSSKPCNPENTGGTGEGTEMHTFTATIDLTQAPFSTYIANRCCDLTFYAGQCCRVGAITTGPAGNDFWISTTINFYNLSKCKNTTNSTPNWEELENLTLCCNAATRFHQNDRTDFEHDSFVYKLAPALSTLPNISVSYSSPFSYLYPMTPNCVPPTTNKCAPDIKTNPPRGFYMDTQTGQLIFTPTKCGEVGVIAVDRYEYRKDTSGKYVQIGRSKNDFILTVKDDCGYNKSPTIESPNAISVCEGDKICFSIYAKDETFTPHQNTPDTVQIWQIDSIPGATFKIINPKNREKEALFCWQTKIGDFNEVAYKLNIHATDKHCPKPSSASKKIIIKVKKKTTVKPYFISSPGICNGIKLSGYCPGLTGTTYIWQIYDSLNNTIGNYTGNFISIKNLNSGKYKIKMTAFNNHFCLPDTSEFYALKYNYISNIGADTAVCNGFDINTLPKIFAPSTYYKYQWTVNNIVNKKDTFLNFKITSIKNPHTLKFTIKDTNGCVWNSNERRILNLKNPTLSLGNDQTFCQTDSVKLNAYSDSFIQYKWSTGDTLSSITVHKTGNYIAKVTAKNGCVARDTVQVIVIAYPLFTTLNAKIFCQNWHGSTLNLNTFILEDGKVMTVRKPNYKAIAFNQDTGSAELKNLVFTGNQFNLTSTPGNWKFKYSMVVNTCPIYDTFNFNLNHSPKVKFTTNPDIITHDDAVFMTNNQSSILDNSKLRYFWNFGRGISDTSNAKNPLVQYKKTNASYVIFLKSTSILGCADSTKKSVEVLLGTQSWLPEGYTLNSSLVLSAKDVSTVELFVFDATGKQVFNAKENKGIGENDLTSGIYFYRLNILKINGSILLYSGKIIR